MTASATDILRECQSKIAHIKEQLSTLKPSNDHEASLQGLVQLLGINDKSSSSSGSPSASSHPTFEQLTDAVVELQEAFSMQDRDRQRVVKMCEDMFLVCEQLMVVARAHDEQLSNITFLAVHRDVVRQFRDAVAEKLGFASWDMLQRRLSEEEDEPEDQRVITRKMTEVLDNVGFSKQDWHELRIIADTSNAIFHSGPTSTLGFKATYVFLKDQEVPQAFASKKGTLLKALSILKDKKLTV